MSLSHLEAPRIVNAPPPRTEPAGWLRSGEPREEVLSPSVDADRLTGVWTMTSGNRPSVTVALRRQA